MPRRRDMSEVAVLLEGDPSQCWTPSIGGLDRSTGYWRITVSGKVWLAHVLAFTIAHGPVPGGMQVDHTCHNADDECRGGISCVHRRCWNPAHLEAVTPAVNVLRGKSPPALNARKATCPEGHEYAPPAKGRRICPICRYQRRVSDGEIKGNPRPETKLECPAGHPYDSENTYIVRNRDGSFKARQCRACSADRARERRRSRHAARVGDR